MEAREFEVNSILDLLSEYDCHQIQAFHKLAVEMKESHIENPYIVWCQYANSQREVKEND